MLAQSLPGPAATRVSAQMRRERPRARHRSWPAARHVLTIALIVAAVGALSCGAVIDEDADRQRLAADRAQLEARVAELESQLSAPPAVALPALADRLVLRQFSRDAARTAAGAEAIELCLQLFGRGDVTSGIPPVLTTSCVVIPVRGDGDAATAIGTFVADPRFECWAGAAPGTNLPPCWR